MAIFTPPVLTPENTNLDKSETKTDTTPHDTDRDQNSKTLTKRVVRPSSLILPSEGKSPRKREQNQHSSSPPWQHLS